MLDAALCRYGHQDIHKLRGVKRLSYDEKRIFSACLQEHLEAEFSPRTDSTPSDDE